MPENNHPITLSDMASGEAATLLIFKDVQVVNNRLASLGFTPGVTIKMLQNFRRGPLIVIVRGARVALGRAEANKIIVERG